MGSDQPHLAPLPTGVTTVLLTAFALPDEGGIQRSVHQIASGLAPDVLVVAPPHPEAETFDPRQSYRTLRRHILGGRLKPSWAWLIPWLWRQRRHGVRMVIFGHCSGACFTTFLFGLFRLKYVVLVHGRDLLAEQRRGAGPMFNWILRHAEWVGVNSTFIQGLVQKCGVPLARIIRTHPAVPDEFVGQHHLADTKRLITVSRLVWRKNVDTVLRALPQIIQRVPELRYDIVGDGPERASLEALVKELQLERHVVFHGRVPDEKRNELLRAAAVFVMAPRIGEKGDDVEGLGLVYLEAAALGLPIIASQTGGVGDVVKENMTGRLVDPDSVEEMVGAVTAAFQRTGLADAKDRQEFITHEFTWSARNGRVRMMLDRTRPAGTISVIIPAYQAAGTIVETLESLWRQTLQPHEVIVVDDGSSDSLPAVLAPYSNRIRYIRQENGGAAVARNTGEKLATGEFLFFLDADIRLSPRTLEDMMRTLGTHPEASYAYPSFRFGPKTFHLFDFSSERLRRMNYIHTTALIRRVAFPGFDPELKKFQDWDLWLTMLERGRTGMWTGNELFTVRQRAIGYSTWLPSFVYRLPLIGRGYGNKTIARYRQAESIIRSKHHLGGVAQPR